MKNEVQRYLNFYKNNFGQEILKKELEYIEMRLNNCKKILSIGCGPALLETRLKQNHTDINIIGLDNSKQMILNASKSIELVYEDAHNLSFDSNSFDAVIYITSLEFIKNYKKSIKEAYRVIKTKGYLLVLMLNPKSIYFKDEYKDKNSYIRNRIKHLDVNKIKTYISQYFVINKEKYFLGFLNKVVFDSSDPEIASLYIIEAMKDI